MMDTRKVEKELADKYGYRPLSPELSKKYRKFYIDNIPEGLSLTGGGVLTFNGTVLCDSYDRIVVGDYGAFIEFSKPGAEFVCTPGQEFRMYDDRYKNKVKYDWLTIKGMNIKIYHQKRTVKYADYKVGKYYVSVHDVKGE